MQFSQLWLPVRMACSVKFEFYIKQSPLSVMNESFHVISEDRNLLFVYGIGPQLPLENCVVLSQVLCDQRKEEILFIFEMRIKSPPRFARGFGNILKFCCFETVASEDAAGDIQKPLACVNGAFLHWATRSISGSASRF
jgi:hypothetical protein